MMTNVWGWFFIVLAEDAIKSAIKDYKKKRSARA